MTFQATAAASELTERLQLYARYLSLVAEELDARSAERGERIAELEEERLAVEAELKQTPDAPASVGSLDEFLNLGLATLQENVERTHQLQERWMAISSGALRTARSVEGPSIRGGRYPEPPSLDRRLDRRL
ncbi:MAG: hypothetical protein WD766_06240 [Gemmatimonadota bacterium]